MSDVLDKYAARVRELYAEGCEDVRARIDELNAEITKVAAESLPDLKRRGFGGAARRVLSDRILERLALQEVVADAAMERAVVTAVESKRKEIEYDERVLKPRREDEAQTRRRQSDYEAHASTVAMAYWRVSQSRQKRERPDDGDVKLLRQNPGFHDTYIRERAVITLLMTMDESPWWATRRTA